MGGATFKCLGSSSSITSLPHNFNSQNAAWLIDTDTTFDLIIMAEHGMTITPNISYTEDGREVVDYGNADIQYGSHKNVQLDEYLDDQESLYFEDEFGNIRHRFANLDPSIYETFEPDYVEGLTSDDFLDDNQLSSDDYDYIADSVGGFDAYQSMTSWAADNLNQEFIEAFDNILESGDVDSIMDAVQTLYRIWMDNGGEVYEQDTYDDYEEEDDYEDEIDEVFADDLMSAIVGDEYTYRHITSWASLNLPAEMVDAYDEVMEYGSREEIISAVQQLVAMYQQHN